MDPITQGVIGATFAQQPSKKSTVLLATLLGFLSGLAPDLDVFIRSEQDPLLALVFHRQFTHSLLFIPIGGLICSTLFYYLITKQKSMTFKDTYIYATIGYATHGLLDSCTSYGTQLLWPFSDVRIAWNTISIIDPSFTIPVLILLIISVTKKNKFFSRLALFWIIFYCILGVIQKERAEKIGIENAMSRGHEILNLEVKPSLGNLFLWKVIYSTKSKYYVDAVKVGFDKKIYIGTNIDKLNIEQSYPWLDHNSQQAKDIERFRWFSGGYIALSQKHPNRIIDIRYSMLPNEVKGLWGIELNENANKEQHIKYIFDRQRDIDSLKKLWNMIVE